MKRPLHRNNFGGHGFTLLELMLSLAVVGVLSAIAIPVYKGHIDKMKINTAITDIYQMKIA
jgi:prepilin-type N-terminal cleavage/methylation domain-containing protein